MLLRELDPITHRPIRKRFCLYRRTVSIPYDADVLFEYITATGDLMDPLCRQRYERHELMRLERVVGTKLPDNVQATFEQERQHSMILEVLMDDVVESLSSAQGNDEAPTIVALDDIRSIVRTAAERDFVVKVLASHRVPAHLLMPLMLLLFETDVPIVEVQI